MKRKVGVTGQNKYKCFEMNESQGVRKSDKRAANILK